MSTANPALVAFLAQQSAEYLLGLPQRGLEVTAQGQALLCASTEAAFSDALSALAQSTHRLAGSSGMFGWSDLGRAASSLEAALGELESLEKLTPAIRKNIEDGLATLLGRFPAPG